MELSKEVHGLLDRIKRLSNAQKQTVDDTYSFDMRMSYSVLEDVEYTPDDLISVEDIDLSNKETWLYTLQPSSNSDTNEIAYRDISRVSDSHSYSDLESFKKNVDTRTFTRPKKRFTRPTNDIFKPTTSTKNKLNGLSEEIRDIDEIKIPENPFDMSLKKDGSISTGPLHFKLSDPVLNHSFDKILFTASDGYDSFINMEPPSLMNSLCSSFMDTSLIQNSSNSILLSDISKSTISNNKSDNLSNDVSQDSLSEYLSTLQMSSEEKVNNLDSTIILTPQNNQKNYDNEKSPALNKTITNTTYTEENTPSDYNLTSTPKMNTTTNEIPKSTTGRKLMGPTKLNKTYEKDLKRDISNRRSSLYERNNENKNLNTTFNALNKSKSNEKTLNSTYVQLNKTDSENSLNSTFTKNKLNTFTKKTRNITNLPESFKLSCPEINKPFQTSLEKSLNRTYQKLSDSQPNLTKDVQQTILNQSMELRNTNVYEGYRNAKCGSTDSLDEKSSSISNSSKESTSKVLNMGDLDNLARLQEQSLHQIMSTPKPTTAPRFWDSQDMSPIPRHEDYLSDSDLTDFSDQCVTARSRPSRPSSGSTGSHESRRLVQVPDIKRMVQVSREVPREVKRPMAAGFGRTAEVRNVKNVPTMVVKPLEVTRTFKQPAKPVQTVSQPMQSQQTRVRPSGLPRPTSAYQTGIPRPMSRIPGPRFNRPQLLRPSSRPVQKSDWNEGCY